MKLKPLIVTVAVLAALSLLAWFLNRPAPPPSADPRLNHALVDAATIEKAAKLRINDAGKNVEITRQTGGTWRVPGYYDFPADFQKLSNFTSELADAKIQRLVTSNPERIARLDFKDTKIELLDSADKPLWALTLGKTPETGGGRFVRFDDEPKAYLASLNTWLDTDPKSWTNTELLNLKADDVAKVEISFPAVAAGASEPKTPESPAATVTLSRAKKEEAWAADKTPANQRVKADKITSLLSSFGNLRFSDTSNPDDPNVVAAREHLRTLTFTTFDHKTVAVALGRKPEEKKLKPTPAAPAGNKTEAPKPEPDKPEAAAPLPRNPTDSEKPEAEPATVTSQTPEPAKPAEPEYETIPAGPVYVFITNSDATAPVNELMKKRAFQIYDYAFTSLPQKPDELFEPVPTPPPAANTEAKKPEAPEPAGEKPKA
jgi:hypothetical protein